MHDRIVILFLVFESLEQYSERIRLPNRLIIYCETG